MWGEGERGREREGERGRRRETDREGERERERERRTPQLNMPALRKWKKQLSSQNTQASVLLHTHIHTHTYVHTHIHTHIFVFFYKKRNVTMNTNAMLTSSLAIAITSRERE